MERDSTKTEVKKPNSQDASHYLKHIIIKPKEIKATTVKEEVQAPKTVEEYVPSQVVKNDQADDIKKLNQLIEQKINSSIEEELRVVKRFIELSSGGGSVATQYANGGVMRGDLSVSGYVSAREFILNTNVINLPPTTGHFNWDSTTGTIALGLLGNYVTRVNEEQVMRVVNKTDVNLLASNYQVVRTRSKQEGGAQGQRAAVVLAQADDMTHVSLIEGVVCQNIDKNQEGYILTSGTLYNINTTGSLQGEVWEDNDTLYLSPDTPGKLTKIRPVAPDHEIRVALVLYAHQTQGRLCVNINNGEHLSFLHDVRIESPLNNQFLQYNSLSGIWVNTSLTDVVSSNGTVSHIVSLTQTQYNNLSAKDATTLYIITSS